MDNPKSLKDSAHLLDDLESIRQLLGDDTLQPPLLTDTVPGEGQIPLLFDVVSGQIVAADEPDAHDVPVLQPEPVAALAAPAPPRPDPVPAAPNPDDLLHLDSELRAAAQLIMQDVIHDFAPHIENEIKRRLEARMERLITAASSGKL
ncbi:MULTISPECIES: DNA polymerase III subunit chi [unclassified Pseudomonas]|uniref:DNA polymerase III subunit chi n=1 Tax=unclassified Pseudomonas TaxID=196821 RepID=UPI000D35DE17|nr:MULTISPECIES: DNA polymerase III subunit chi [unclassified Pseudomonas]RAU46914.1 DNA polymerase III subunit chi [Pseudomonas sp. RIT 409]RAU54530.1 DNA polymerase III subunit chi [Pseudomonas sp. RIT 412]